MKKTITILIITMISIITTLAIVTNAGSGQTKSKLGPCVKECVQAYNPSLADSGAESFLVADFNAENCVNACNEGIQLSECAPNADTCCNTYFQNTDPDCESDLQCNPETQSGCTTGLYCTVDSTCTAKLQAGDSCTEGYQCLSTACTYDPELGHNAC